MEDGRFSSLVGTENELNSGGVSLMYSSSVPRGWLSNDMRYVIWILFVNGSGIKECEGEKEEEIC